MVSVTRNDDTRSTGFGVLDAGNRITKAAAGSSRRRHHARWRCMSFICTETTAVPRATAAAAKAPPPIQARMGADSPMAAGTSPISVSGSAGPRSSATATTAPAIATPTSAPGASCSAPSASALVIAHTTAGTTPWLASGSRAVRRDHAPATVRVEVTDRVRELDSATFSCTPCSSSSSRSCCIRVKRFRQMFYDRRRPAPTLTRQSAGSWRYGGDRRVGGSSRAPLERLVQCGMGAPLEPQGTQGVRPDRADLLDPQARPALGVVEAARVADLLEQGLAAREDELHADVQVMEPVERA